MKSAELSHPETELDVYSALLAAFLRRPGHPGLQELLSVRTLLGNRHCANVKSALPPPIVFYAVPDLGGHKRSSVHGADLAVAGVDRAELRLLVGYVGHHFRRGNGKEADRHWTKPIACLSAWLPAPKFLRIYRARRHLVV